jgi:hypothetical protein
MRGIAQRSGANHDGSRARIDLTSWRTSDCRRVRRPLLPQAVIARMRVRYLYPTLVAAPPGQLAATWLTIPSPRRVFTRYPLVIWMTQRTLVLARPRGATFYLEQRLLELQRADPSTALGALLEAVAASHSAVVQALNDTFFPTSQRLCAPAWHRKERRLQSFIQLLQHEVDLLQKLHLARVAEQVDALLRICLSTAQKVAESQNCPICRAPDLLRPG